MCPALQRGPVDENTVMSKRFYLFVAGSWLHFFNSPPLKPTLLLSDEFYSFPTHARPAFKSPENARYSTARSGDIDNEPLSILGVMNIIWLELQIERNSHLSYVHFYNLHTHLHTHPSPIYHFIIIRWQRNEQFVEDLYTVPYKRFLNAHNYFINVTAFFRQWQ